MANELTIEQKLAAQLTVNMSETKALVSLLSPEMQSEWLKRHRENCERMGIDSVTGEPLTDSA